MSLEGRRKTSGYLEAMDLDSTIGSRMSSRKVPQMELLQINYVQRRNKALQNNSQLFYTKVGSTENMRLHGLDIHNKKKLQRSSLPPTAVDSWRSIDSVSGGRGRGGGGGGGSSTLSQNRTHGSPTNLHIANEQADCEKSHSWNYRSRTPLCHLPVDNGEMDIKTRARRMSYIKANNACSPKTNVLHRASLPNATDCVPTAGASAAARFSEVLRHQRSSLHHVAGPLMMKEPNRRLRPLSCDMLKSESHAIMKSPVNSRHIACNSLSVAQKEGKMCSRIPQPVYANNNYGFSSTTHKDHSKLTYKIARKPTEKFNKNACSINGECGASNLPFSKGNKPGTKLSLDKVLSDCRLSEMPVGMQLPPAIQLHKIKAERIHIRKKRQSLHIINQCVATKETDSSVSDAVKPPTRSVLKYNGRTEEDSYSCNLNAERASVTVKGKPNLRKTEHTAKSASACCTSPENSSCNSNSSGRPAQERPHSKLFNGAQANKQSYSKLRILHKNADDCANKSCEANKPTNDKPTKVEINSRRSAVADPNDVQNFAKKNLTKATTDEALAATVGGGHATAKTTKPKQCNIENDLKYNEHRKCNNLQQQCNNALAIDDNWIKEGNELLDFDCDVSATAGGRNSSCNNTVYYANSPNSTAKYKSTQAAAVKNKSYLIIKDAYSAAAVATENATASAASAVAAVGRRVPSEPSECTTACCIAAVSADNRSLASSAGADCCCDFLEKPFNSSSTGLFFNGTINNNLASSSCTDTTRANTTSPICSMQTSSSSETSCAICVSETSDDDDDIDANANANAVDIDDVADGFAAVCNAPLGCKAVCGLFQNNSYCHHDNNSSDVDEECCCSFSSCDDDDCSYYGGERYGTLPQQLLHAGEMKCVPKNAIDIKNSKQHVCQHFQTDTLRNSRVENLLLLRRNKNFKKAHILHELRPRSLDGVIDSGVSLNGETGSSPDGSDHIENQQDVEALRLKRGHVLTELLETERIYVNEMGSILKGYRDQMLSEEMMHLVPASLQGKEDVLFGNLHELYKFHSEIFLKDLDNCISSTELVALCFVQRRDAFYHLYSFYCQNIPRSDRLRETLTDTHFFLQECQIRLGHKLPLAAYLLKPVQRITKYQLLLKDLLRFSESGSCTKELQRALECMLIVLKCVNDSMHQVAITGFPDDLLHQGELLLQDSFQVWSDSKKDIRLRIKPQQRRIFLYQKSMLFCKQTSKPGLNKSTYQFKHCLKMSQIGLTESIRGDTKRFEVWLQGRQEVHTLQAPTNDIKQKWVSEIKRVLLNQLEELKDEKIKQYGLNHGGKTPIIWDAANVMAAPFRSISIEASSGSSKRSSNGSNLSDDSCLIEAATKDGKLSVDREHEACGWSSDCSNSEDEISTIEENSTPGSKYVTLADYTAMGHSEVSIREGDIVELLKVGCAGWWYIRVLDINVEGWAPAAYLDAVNKKPFRASNRNSEPNHCSKGADY